MAAAKAANMAQASSAIERIAVLGGGAWGTALAETAVRGGPRGNSVGTRRRQCRHARQPARKQIPAGRAHRQLDRDHARTQCRGESPSHPAGGARAKSGARRGGLPQRLSCQGNAGDRLRQRHRARHAQIHDRDRRRMRAQRGAGDFVRPELCRRRGARPADRRHAGLQECQNRRSLGACDELGSVPPLSFDRRARGRDRRRRQERAGDCRRDRRRARAGRQRRRRDD